MRFVWKHFPLDFHKDAPLAHKASIAAHNQGKFWEYRNEVFSEIQNLKKDNLVKHARKVGLDLARFEADLAAPETAKKIDADMAEMKALGITGTPGFFVNGKFLSGAKPFEEFAKMINEELRKLGKPVPPEAASL